MSLQLWRCVPAGSSADAALAAQCMWCGGVHPHQLVARPEQESGSTVLVAGATGGVGQLVTAKLLEVGAPGGMHLLAEDVSAPRQLAANGQRNNSACIVSLLLATCCSRVALQHCYAFNPLADVLLAHALMMMHNVHHRRSVATRCVP